MDQVNGTSKSQLHAGRVNEDTNHFTGVQLDEKYVGVMKT
jgi:hypothetical protein